MKRFRGDLWQCDRGTLRTAVEQILTGRGVARVLEVSRDSGLYATALVEESPGSALPHRHIITVGESEIRDYVWQHTDTAGNN